MVTPTTSSLAALPVFTTSTSFTVSYTASDPGSNPSGLAGVDVYVKGPTDGDYHPAHAFTGASLSSGNFSYTAGEGDGSNQMRVGPIVSGCSPKPASRPR